MHISLDSALGQQRRLNSVGESITQIAPDPAAAYSLRSLTGGDPKVVRVRRGSDNHEQDFTASDVSSGALQDFVNAQVTAPLDIREIADSNSDGDNDGRVGDFLIANAAYSLRSLGTRQATLAATGDTVARANGKFVCQVRRDSDDALKSFTATEIIDGTLLSFVNEDVITEQSDFTSGVDGYAKNTHGTVSREASFEGKSDVLKYAFASTGRFAIAKTSVALDRTSSYTISFEYYADSEYNGKFWGIETSFASRVSASSNTPTVVSGAWTSVTLNVPSGRATGLTTLHIRIQDTANNTLGLSGITANVRFKNIVVTQTTGSGFVRTWYDQSVTNQAGDTATGNHATQATAANQPKIVSDGALLADGIDFDGSEDMSLVTGSFSLTQAYTTFSVSHTDVASTSQGVWSTAPSVSNQFNATSFFRSDGGFAVNSGVTRTTAGTIDYATNRDYLQTNIVNGGFSSVFVDGATGSTGNAGTSNPSGVLILGLFRVSSANSNLDGGIKEVIIYDSDQTDNRTAIEANIGEAYSIDLPSGVDPGFDQVDGFVETWYDQSGNGRDSTNTTAAQQPIIVEAGVFQDGLKFTHTDTTNGKRLFVPRTTADLGTEFALVWVGKVTSNTSTISNILGATRNVVSFATGTVGLSIKANSGTSYFLNEQTTSAREVLSQSSVITLNEDSVVFANYDDASVLLSVDGSTSTATFSSPVLTRAKNLGIMNATGNSTSGYRTQESPTGICREVLVYDTNQTDNRVSIETNINSHYSLF